jgi:hypothetical protein
LVSSWVCHGINEGIKTLVSSELFPALRYQSWDVYPKGILTAVVDAFAITPQIHVSLSLRDEPKGSGFLGGISD